MLSTTQHSSLSLKLLLLSSLVFALFQVKRYDDQEQGEGVTSAKLPAFLSSLKGPSLRVFRGLFEFALVLVGTSISLRVWEHTFNRSSNYDEQRNHRGKSINEYLGLNVIGHLLFRPANSELAEAEAVFVPVDIFHGELDYENDEQALIEETRKVTLNKKCHDFQPPTSIAVANAATDVLLLLVLFLFLFTVGSISKARLNEAYDTASISSIQRIVAGLAPAFPLIVFFILVLTVFLPWSKRSLFWKVVLLTIEAPMAPVSFRDGIVGDILTSVVRPTQDTAFACFYLASILLGCLSSRYDLDEAAETIERSWLLNNVIIPACMILPLWMRFMQCLRQCYETKQRWPYLGNAMKYMIAAEVALFGAFHPEKRKTFSWNASFFVATLYQTFWDVFFDWEIFQIKINKDQQEDVRARAGICGKRQDFQHSAKGKVLFSISLREKRLYSHRSMYYTIFVINLLLRFFWTLSLIPSDHLMRSGKLVKQVGIGIQRFATPMIAVAEIIRRTLWGLLRVELQAIKLIEDKEKINYDMTLDDMQPMQVCLEGERNGLQSRSTGLFKWFAHGIIFNGMASATDFQIVSELCIWSAVFVGWGIFAVANGQ